MSAATRKDPVLKMRAYLHQSGRVRLTARQARRIRKALNKERG